ncbi:putative sensor histidine kinase TcrY [Clostridium acetireducens DSM 10703]|uniref:histidine kinase n=1 Tax=Clostridium acetireducens DSM 10703 TaxID=1121290 RepID=A0A1E8EVS7_9CLOT|nr:HAMP domain-containing sensor histidine kinase [Clostridium acetireducens]OFI01377.1 putative sensor histidine kinase TcrY [Clostridium acetireducens DSM 10703]
MKNSIKFKFSLGLLIIYFISAIGLNILIRLVFKSNIENIIKNSTKDIMKNSREHIEYKFTMAELPLNENSLIIESNTILDYLQKDYNCDGEIRNKNGEIICRNVEGKFKNIADESVKEALKGQALAKLNYINNELYVVFSFPLYYENKSIGIITIVKDYSELYKYNKIAINLITLIEILIFIMIFIVSLIFTNKITTPITNLTKAVKNVSQGNYESYFEVKSNDEIGLLSMEFINMRNKIKHQIDTINKEKEKVIKLEKGRREFFNNVTHELKTPLTAISGYAQILLDENVKDEKFKIRASNRIYMESERLHELVLDLISVSKGLSNIEENKEILDMKKLLTEICEDMKIKANKYNLKLISNINEGYIYGQSNKIRQLVINILDNAIKYSWEGEKIFVKSLNEEGFFILEVCNKGNKIPEDIYNNIFNPFVKSPVSMEKHSRGLGLYICTEILKEHNGEIKIENDNLIKITIKIPYHGNNLETT